MNSSRPRSAQYPGRQIDQCPEQLKYSLDGNAQQTERQSQEPNQRIEQNGQQGQRPADYQQYQPEQEFTHVNLLDVDPFTAKWGNIRWDRLRDFFIIL
jgi:hypothetical protein